MFRWTASSTEVKNERSYTPTSWYAFMARTGTNSPISFFFSYFQVTYFCAEVHVLIQQRVKQTYHYTGSADLSGHSDPISFISLIHCTLPVLFNFWIYLSNIYLPFHHSYPFLILRSLDVMFAFRFLQCHSQSRGSCIWLHRCAFYNYIRYVYTAGMLSYVCQSNKRNKL